MKDYNASFKSDRKMPCVVHILDLLLTMEEKKLDTKLAWIEEDLAEKVRKGSKESGTPFIVAQFGNFLVFQHTWITTIRM